ncbi:hypothetical protein Hdeb2414_s0134g00807771 [Helianthus debilis subsp. tardiflorus]
MAQDKIIIIETCCILLEEILLGRQRLKSSINVNYFIGLEFYLHALSYYAFDWQKEAAHDLGRSPFVNNRGSLYWLSGRQPSLGRRVERKFGDYFLGTKL